jgi:hypothetical protein
MPLISYERRIRRADRMQNQFGRDSRRLANAITKKGARISTFQKRGLELIRQHGLTQAMLGKGNYLTPREQADFEERLQFHTGKFQDFVDEIALRRAQGKPYSKRYIANRLESYSGFGRGEMFRLSGIEEDDGDTVEDYIALDDGPTCSPCHEAAAGGPYLPGEGPFPGQVCKGRGKCRCRRSPRADKRKARQLKR